jgi:hypothetical protein
MTGTQWEVVPPFVLIQKEVQAKRRLTPTQRSATDPDVSIDISHLLFVNTHYALCIEGS